jgi:hypothetical protein
MRFFGGWIAAQSSQGRRPKTHPQMTQMDADSSHRDVNSRPLSAPGVCEQTVHLSAFCNEEGFVSSEAGYANR